MDEYVFQGSPQKVSESLIHRGGVDIKWNGPLLVHLLAGTS